MRRFWLLMGSLLLISHLVLGGVVLMQRIIDGDVCLYYRTYAGETLVQGVIDSTTGKVVTVADRPDWNVIFTNERYSLMVNRYAAQPSTALGRRITPLDLAITSATPDTIGRDHSYTLLGTGITIPQTPDYERYDKLDYATFVATGLITIPGHIAFRWLDTNLDPFLTLVKEDGTDHRVVCLDPAHNLDMPVAWSADANYVLMRTSSDYRFQPYAILDTHTLQIIALPAPLNMSDAAYWQTTVWSPTGSQFAIIRPAT